MATYYVDDVNGSDGSGDGTSNNPWASAAHAIAFTTGSDTISFVNGTSSGGDFNNAMGLPDASVVYGNFGPGNAVSGTLSLPDANYVLTSTGNYGVSGNGSTPNYYPIDSSYILTGHSYGVGNTDSGGLTLPDADYVLTSVPDYGINGTGGGGLATYPPGIYASVKLISDYAMPTYGIGGTSETPTLTFPNADYVISGSDYGVGGTGGGANATLPDASLVTSLTPFGIGNANVGTFVGIVDSSGSTYTNGIINAGIYSATGIFDGTTVYSNGIFDGTTFRSNGIWYGGTATYAASGIFDGGAIYGAGQLDASTVYHTTGILDSTATWNQVGILCTNDAGATYTYDTDGILDTYNSYYANGAYKDGIVNSFAQIATALNPFLVDDTANQNIDESTYVTFMGMTPAIALSSVAVGACTDATLTVPDSSYVLVDAGGTLTIPSGSDVQSNASAFGIAGTSETPSYPTTEATQSAIPFPYSAFVDVSQTAWGIDGATNGSMDVTALINTAVDTQFTTDQNIVISQENSILINSNFGALGNPIGNYDISTQFSDPGIAHVETGTSYTFDGDIQNGTLVPTVVNEIEFPPSTLPASTVNAFLPTRDKDGVPQPNTPVYYRLVSTTQTGTNDYSPQAILSNEYGIAEITMMVNSYYQYWSNIETHTVHITPLTTDPYLLPEVEG